MKAGQGGQGGSPVRCSVGSQGVREYKPVRVGFLNCDRLASQLRFLVVGRSFLGGVCVCGLVSLLKTEVQEEELVWGKVVMLVLNG